MRLLHLTKECQINDRDATPRYTDRLKVAAKGLPLPTDCSVAARPGGLTPVSVDCDLFLMRRVRSSPGHRLGLPLSREVGGNFEEGERAG